MALAEMTTLLSQASRHNFFSSGTITASPHAARARISLAVVRARSIEIECTDGTELILCLNGRHDA